MLTQHGYIIKQCESHALGAAAGIYAVALWYNLFSIVGILQC